VETIIINITIIIIIIIIIITLINTMITYLKWKVIKMVNPPTF